MFNKLLKALGFTKPSPAETSTESTPQPPDNQPEKELDLAELLIEVAQEFEDSDKFKEAASVVANKLEFSRAKELTQYFHQNPPEPEALKSKTQKYGLFGVWMSICQDAIFEILFNYKAQAIPTLYSIGFGKNNC